MNAPTVQMEAFSEEEQQEEEEEEVKEVNSKKRKRKRSPLGFAATKKLYHKSANKLEACATALQIAAATDIVRVYKRKRFKSMLARINEIVRVCRQSIYPRGSYMIDQKTLRELVDGTSFNRCSLLRMEFRRNKKPNLRIEVVGYSPNPDSIPMGGDVPSFSCAQTTGSEVDVEILVNDQAVSDDQLMEYLSAFARHGMSDSKSLVSQEAEKSNNNYVMNHLTQHLREQFLSMCMDFWIAIAAIMEKEMGDGMVATSGQVQKWIKKGQE